MSNRLLLMALLFCFPRSSMADMNFEAAGRAINVVSFNIDTNIERTEEGDARDAYPEWRIVARMPKIFKALQAEIDSGADVIQIQEGRRFINKFGDVVDSVKPLVDFLKSNNYTVSTMRYNPSDRAFFYITAVKSTFTIDAYGISYFTKTPIQPTDHFNHVNRIEEIKKHNYGQEWERCVYITQFHDEHTQYYALNVHLGIEELHRTVACEQLKNVINGLIEKNPLAKIFITGTFNTFPNLGGIEQLKIMQQDCALNEVSNTLVLENGVLVDSSFIAFPYDWAADGQRLKDIGKEVAALEPLSRKQAFGEIFNRECKALCGQLDRIYAYGFEKSVAILVPTPQYSDWTIDQFNEEEVKAFIMRHYNDGPAFASDNQILKARLVLKN